MAELGELLDRMTVRANSPDGNITAQLSERTSIDFSFRPDTYYEYDASGLEHQLAALLRLLEVSRLKGRKQAFQEAEIEVVESSQPHWNANRRRYREAVAEIAAIGMAEGVEIGTVGFTGFRVTVDPDVLDQLSEEEFVAQLRRAVSDLISDHQQQLFALKREHLGK